MKIIHFSDLHYSKVNSDRALASLHSIMEVARAKDINAFIFSGDMFDRGILNTKDSGFTALIDAIKEMLSIAPIISVYGTPTHDIPGCYDVLENLNSKYAFKVLKAGEKAFISSTINNTERKVLILGCPEPQKQHFLKDKSLGREDANKTLTQELRNLFLGLGAVRQSYKDLPCIFIYHGTVAGSTMCNGQLVKPGEITIGIDDLNLIDADYYALGHIHKAQKLYGDKIFYTGSAFPVNWGETDQKTFNLVEFNGNKTQTIFYAYPHPPRIKIISDYSDEPLNENIKGKQVWHEYKVNKSVARIINQEKILEKMLISGALPGSRVTVSIINDETVRADGIKEAQTLCKKVEIYSQNTGQNIPESIYEKAKELESKGEKAEITKGLYIQIDKLKLRGSTGIKKGLKTDEIEIDFTKYLDGLIGLCGENGSGKTSILENLHPYSCLLTRPGKLQDHFCLKDSYRDLYFTDVKNGDRYRAFISLDGSAKTGKAEYFLYKNDNPITNGRKEDYDKKIESLFGSLSLFLKSAFVSQKPPKNFPELQDATKGERKAIFRELAGLDYLQLYSDSAREKMKTISNELTQNKIKLEQLESLKEKIKTAEQRSIQLQTELIELETNIKETEKQKEQQEAFLVNITKKLEINLEIGKEIKITENKYNDIEKEIAEYKKIIHTNKEIISLKEYAEIQLKKYETLCIEKEKEEKDAEIIREKQIEISGLQTKIQAEITEIRFIIEKCELKKQTGLKQIDSILNRLSNKITCPKCSHSFSIQEEDLQAELEELQQTVLDLDIDIVSLEKERDIKKKELQAIVFPQLSTRLKEIIYEIKDLDIEKQREIISKANSSEYLITDYEKRITENNKTLEALGKTLTDLKSKYNLDLVKEHETANYDLNIILNIIDKFKSNIIEKKSIQNEIKKQLVSFYEEEKQFIELKYKIDEQSREIVEWTFLMEACGADGIQALELDALSPMIAEISNKLLESAYGNRFLIEFQTTRIGGSGSKTRQIEDFLILIHDTENETIQEMNTLSGGETVWIRRAIYDALGIVRANNTGLKFLTAFQDEADGALDVDKKIAYFKMLEAAHNESGRHKTIIITHSEEVKEMLSQKIIMEDLKA